MNTVAPIADTGRPERPATVGAAIALSGGGYRAMLFHTGALWRMGQIGFYSGKPLSRTDAHGLRSEVGRLERISSVSGGSILAAKFALAYDSLSPLVGERFDDEYSRQVVAPIRTLAGITLAGISKRGVWEVLKDILLPGSINDHIAAAYDRHLYQGKTLQDLPDSVRFVINASNLQSGALWRFSKPFMRDWRVGEVKHPTVSLARAVGASSAFPPVLAPAMLKLREQDYTPGSGAQGDAGLQRKPFTTSPTLADGGVYDNLGLETCYKGFLTLFVSNAGKPFAVDGEVSRNWVSVGARCLDMVDNQVLNLRKRLLIGAYKAGERRGAFWDIQQSIATYTCADQLPCPTGNTRRLAAVATDLAAKDAALQERLINWGYAVADASIRSWFDPTLTPPARFPYPGSGV